MSLLLFFSVDDDVLGLEFWDIDLAGNGGYFRSVLFLREPKNVSHDVGCSLDELHVQLVSRVELDDSRRSLRSGPERQALVGLVVEREAVKQLRDLVRVDLGEDLSSQRHKPLVALLPVTHQQLQSLQLSQVLHRLLLELLLALLEKCFGIIEIFGDVGRTLDENALEVVAGPLDAVVNFEGEVLESAQGDGLLGRIGGLAVAGGKTRENHLGVALGAERSGLEERLSVPQAARVDVLSGLDVVDGVNDDIEVFPEVVVEHFFAGGVYE